MNSQLYFSFLTLLALQLSWTVDCGLSAHVCICHLANPLALHNKSLHLGEIVVV